MVQSMINNNPDLEWEKLIGKIIDQLIIRLYPVE